MKIYAITKGEYSDYHICAVTDDEEKAKTLKLIESDEYEEARIEEYDTEEPIIESAKRDNKYFVVEFNCEGEATNVYECTPHNPNKFEYAGMWKVALIAQDEKSAIKIAAERRAKYLAGEQGI